MTEQVNWADAPDGAEAYLPHSKEQYFSWLKKDPVTGCTMIFVPGVLQAWTEMGGRRDYPYGHVLRPATPPAAQVQGEQPSYGWRKEALAFVGVAEAGAFADLRAAVKTAAMIIQGLLNDDTVQLIREHRIALTPEYEGQWHAELYGDDGVAQKYAEGATPDEAVRAVLSSTALTPTHIEDGEEVDVTDAMLEKAMNARMPGGAPAWVWLFNCEGGQQPEDKHKDWFRIVLRAALSAPPAAGVPEGWKLIPAQPNEAMLNQISPISGKEERLPYWWYQALIKSAPTPPASEQQQAVEAPEPFMFVKLHAGDVMDWTQDPSLAEYWAEEGDTVAELYSGHDLRLNPNLQPAAPSQGESE
ncbi:hypothetical protein [Pseudomonas sp. zfem005]|uniref:hypothetical protein n=1 Tax=Pseudomonas sp. zfem005 TaxID=3078200 RepID=UPI002928CA55|nr:hypothetical protein [Pseudomonas sp. zfem005]MDU9415529.1 hypothetical protein [Pseudomonas sp. zfem005]